MFTKPESHPSLKTRKQSVDAIHHALARFPLVVEILEDLAKAEIPCPGDVDIRHGCERALTAMLAGLAKIDPAPAGKPSKSEESAMTLIHTEAAGRLVHADLLQRIQQFIERILGSSRRSF